MELLLDEDPRMEDQLTFFIQSMTWDVFVLASDKEDGDTW